MKKRLLTTAIVLLSLLGVWLFFFPVSSWSYKLTLVVDDNGKQVTGSAVRKVIASREPKLLPEQAGGRASVKGEAVVVDLGAKGTLFALLRSEKTEDYGYYIVFDLFPMAGGGQLTPEGMRYYSNLEGKRDVPFGKLPMLVRFRDINDPKTVEKVDPNNLAKSFGPGVKLVSATIEMTNEEVTRGIEERLKWLPQRKNTIGYLGGWPEDPTKLYLNGSEFSKGVLK